MAKNKNTLGYETTVEEYQGEIIIIKQRNDNVVLDEGSARYVCRAIAKEANKLGWKI